MARDIAGFLTGIESTQQPVQQAVPGSPNFYGEFMAARGRGLQQGLGGLLRGGAPSTQEQIQGAMFELSSPTAGGAAKDTATRIADLTKLARVQQVQGNPAAAAQTAAQIQKLKEQEQKKTQEEQAGLRASSMATALKTAGHEELARQVELGDTEAYKRGLQLISPEKGKTSIEDIVDPATGVTHKVVLSSDGTILRTVGVSKMPKLKSVGLPNGQIVWENEATGTRGEPQDTPEAASQERDRVDKLYSDLAAVDNVLVTVSEAKKLAEDEYMTTGVFYNLASMPYATDARTLQTKITTLQSTLAFDRLQKMRDESKTGGALGQVSNIELQLLQSALTALDPIVGKEEFTKQLEKVQKHYTNFKKALLGEPLDIDWSRPEYKGKTTVVDGVRYMVDPTDPTKVFAIGEE
ncbi:MAG: hypothetical protein ACPG45_11255 [Flavobacteriaceae bacterium]